MDIYTVKTGENIYDVAVDLYGSVEGVFDLLLSNNEMPDGGMLTFDTTLKAGMRLYYHSDFKLDESLPWWIKENGVRVRHGEHPVRKCISDKVSEYAKEKGIITDGMSYGEKDERLAMLTKPRLLMLHTGEYIKIGVTLLDGTLMFVDWGDESEAEAVKGTGAEHSYADAGEHRIVLHGDFELGNLDLSGLKGIYYPLNEIRTQSFTGNGTTDTSYNKLITVTK